MKEFKTREENSIQDNATTFNRYSSLLYNFDIMKKYANTKRYAKITEYIESPIYLVGSVPVRIRGWEIKGIFNIRYHSSRLKLMRNLNYYALYHTRIPFSKRKSYKVKCLPMSQYKNRRIE